MHPFAQIQAVQHIRPMGNRTQTHLVLGEDRQLYVVRLLSPSQRHHLISSFVGSRLGKALGLPTSECLLIHVPKVLLRNTSAQHGERDTGLDEWTNIHLGTRFAGGFSCQNVSDLLPGIALASLNNRASFLHMLAFDKWCSHLGPPRSVFYRALGGSNYNVEFVNKSPSFCGPSLCFRDDPLNGVYRQREVYHNVTGMDMFEPFLTDLILTSHDTLWKAVSDLPFNWSRVHSGELEVLVCTLVQRRSQIRSLIAQSRDKLPDLFPAWTRRAYVPAPLAAQVTTIRTVQVHQSQ